MLTTTTTPTTATHTMGASDAGASAGNGRNVRTRLALRAGAAALAALGALTLAAPAPADAAATPGTTILVVHGFDGGGLGDLPLDSAVDCRNATITRWVRGLRARGFTDVRTVGYYRGDTGCDVNLPTAVRADNTVNTSIDQIARELADTIEATFTSRGVNVAISGHSMGGVIVRRALHGVQDGHADFPETLLVSDVVTSGSPHAGAGVAAICGVLPAGVPTQCVQLAPGSAFLRALAHNPQGTGGTDWTVIGSDCDVVVSGASGVAMNQVSPNRPAVARVRFPAPSLLAGGCPLSPEGFDHTELVTAARPLDAIRNGLLTAN